MCGSSSSDPSREHFTDNIFPLNTADAIPNPLFVVAARMPATWVPCAHSLLFCTPDLGNGSLSAVPDVPDASQPIISSVYPLLSLSDPSKNGEPLKSASRRLFSPSSFKSLCVDIKLEISREEIYPSSFTSTPIS